MHKSRTLIALLALNALLPVACLAAARSAPPQPESLNEADARHVAERGVNMMMNGDLDGAIAVFRQIERNNPDSPLGYVLEADATWWEIYYASADLIDPDVFDVANMPGTPYDSHFDDIDSVAIHKAEARIHQQDDVARNSLYEGFAYALKARLDGLRDHDLATARAGKKMRTLLLHSTELDPNLTDAYLGIGIYNYFVDTLPSIVKVLSVFIGLPGGSRTEGLQQLQLCANKGELGRPEAKFYLAKDYSRGSERQYDKSAHLFGELQKEFPNNPLWPMLVGSLEYRMGRPQKGEALYREVYEKTTGKTSEVDSDVHKAATRALERIHPMSH